MLPHIPSISRILFIKVSMNSCLAAFAEALKLVCAPSFDDDNVWLGIEKSVHR